MEQLKEIHILEARYGTQPNEGPSRQLRVGANGVNSLTVLPDLRVAVRCDSGKEFLIWPQNVAMGERASAAPVVSSPPAPLVEGPPPTSTASELPPVATFSQNARLAQEEPRPESGDGGSSPSPRSNLSTVDVALPSSIELSEPASQSAETAPLRETPVSALKPEEGEQPALPVDVVERVLRKPRNPKEKKK